VPGVARRVTAITPLHIETYNDPIKVRVKAKSRRRAVTTSETKKAPHRCGAFFVFDLVEVWGIEPQASRVRF
jgi:hypothetical protein